ncbi:MAG TPA: response regulator transcription factor [Anaerolineales bacterium]|nr:response regulator transcription factor [Anaerolineales bacterium]
MAQTILVIDDSADLRRMVKDYLTAEGFRVVTAADGQEALFVARHEKPDLILLDLMMPELSGYEFLRIYSKEADTPVIMLTARMEESDKVVGLELGADDYVTKPFSPRELTARVRAVLRRAGRAPSLPEVLRASDVELDRETRSVRARGSLVDLTPFEFDLLAALMTAPGRVFTRLDLLTQVQGDTFAGYERNIDVHIRHLRTKIEPDPGEPRYIQTVYGVGYRFAAEE